MSAVLRFPGKGTWAGRSVWSIADNLSQQALSFVIFAVLARWLSPQEFGLLAIAHLMVQFVRMSLLDAIALPVIRSHEVNDALFNWLFSLCTAVSALVACLMALAAAPLAHFFSAPKLLHVLLGMSLSVLLFGLVRAHEARLLREGNFRLLAIRSMCSVAAGGVVALVLASRGAGAMALVAQQLVMGGVGLLIAVAAEWRVWRPRWAWSTPLIRQHAREMTSIGTSALLNYANTNGDAALVSVVLGPYATGLYNLAKRVLSAAYLIVGASLSRVSVSMFVQQQKDPVALRRSYTRVLALTLLLLLPVYTIATMVAEPLVVTAFGEQWRRSAPLFGWLSVAFLGQAVLGLGQSLSFTTKLAGRVFRLSLMQLAISCVMALVFSRAGGGVVGVAAGFALGSVAGCVAMLIATSRQLGLSGSQLFTAALPSLAGAAAAAAALFLLPQSGVDLATWLGLLIAGALGMTAYAATAAIVHWLLRRSKPQ